MPAAAVYVINAVTHARHNSKETRFQEGAAASRPDPETDGLDEAEFRSESSRAHALVAQSTHLPSALEIADPDAGQLAQIAEALHLDLDEAFFRQLLEAMQAGHAPPRADGSRERVQVEDQCNLLLGGGRMVRERRLSVSVPPDHSEPPAQIELREGASGLKGVLSFDIPEVARPRSVAQAWSLAAAAVRELGLEEIPERLSVLHEIGRGDGETIFELAPGITLSAAKANMHEQDYRLLANFAGQPELLPLCANTANLYIADRFAAIGQLLNGCDLHCLARCYVTLKDRARAAAEIVEQYQGKKAENPKLQFLIAYVETADIMLVAGSRSTEATILDDMRVLEARRSAHLHAANTKADASPLSLELELPSVGDLQRALRGCGFPAGHRLAAHLFQYLDEQCHFDPEQLFELAAEPSTLELFCVESERSGAARDADATVSCMLSREEPEAGPIVLHLQGAAAGVAATIVFVRTAANPAPAENLWKRVDALLAALGVPPVPSDLSRLSPVDGEIGSFWLRSGEMKLDVERASEPPRM